METTKSVCGSPMPAWVSEEHEAAQAARRAQEMRHEEQCRARAKHVYGVMVGLLDEVLPGWQARLHLDFAPDGRYEVLHMYCRACDTAPRLRVGAVTCQMLCDDENDLTLLVADDETVSFDRSGSTATHWQRLGSALYGAFMYQMTVAAAETMERGDEMVCAQCGAQWFADHAPDCGARPTQELAPDPTLLRDWEQCSCGGRVVADDPHDGTIPLTETCQDCGRVYESIPF